MTLKDNVAEDGFENEIKVKEELHDLRMKKRVDDDAFQININNFDKVLKKFKSNNKRNYDFITKAGDKFKSAIFSLIKRMLEDEIFPANFDNTFLHQIWKQKGEKSVLKNNRYIHSKGWLPNNCRSYGC